MKMTIMEKKALYTFGCPDLDVTVERLLLLAAITSDPVAGELFCNLAVRLSDEGVGEWYSRFFHTLRMEMKGYYDAEMIMKLAEVSTYDMEDDYDEADEV